MTLELYKVTVEYVSPSETEQWERLLKVYVKNAPDPSVPYDVPRPSPKRAERYAAVHGQLGSASLAEAGTLALCAVVGPQDCWERFQAQAVAVEYVGSVAAPTEEGTKQK